MAISDSKSRLLALRELLEKEEATTQEELREQLEKMDFEVNQSTVSRDLRRLGAIKMTDNEGITTYRLPFETAAAVPMLEGMGNLIRDMDHNGALIVIHTTPGSASLIARHIDGLRSDDVLGTIAGDDTVFVAPSSLKRVDNLMKRIEESLNSPVR